MGRTGNMIIKDFMRQMCIPLDNMYFGDGDGISSNPDSQWLIMLSMNMNYMILCLMTCITGT